jgi:hypothetical protein
LISYLSIAQYNEKSFIRFNKFSEDTLQIINIDKMKFDINLRISKDSTVYEYFATGKIGVINKLDILNFKKKTNFRFFSGNNKYKFLELKFPKNNENIKLLKTTIDKPYSVEYKIKDLDYLKKEKFSLSNLINIINNLNLKGLTFVGGKYDVFFKFDETTRDDYDFFNKDMMYVLLNKDDIKYINVFKDDELILKIDYHLLVK